VIKPINFNIYKSKVNCIQNIINCDFLIFFVQLEIFVLMSWFHHANQTLTTMGLVLTCKMFDSCWFKNKFCFNETIYCVSVFKNVKKSSEAYVMFEQVSVWNPTSVDPLNLNLSNWKDYFVKMIFVFELHWQKIFRKHWTCFWSARWVRDRSRLQSIITVFYCKTVQE
jgi:hypothetical protein